jgi:hypothetical protein
MHKIEINKQIPQERWGEFFEMFTHSNKERLIHVEALDQEKGDEELIEAAPLSFIDYQPGYQPETVRNNLIIHTGDNGLHPHRQ